MNEEMRMTDEAALTSGLADRVVDEMEHVRWGCHSVCCFPFQQASAYFRAPRATPLRQ
jgi:hypothetical protein